MVVRAAILVAVLAAQTAGSAFAIPGYNPPAPSPARRYGLLSQDACEAELTARGIPFVRQEPTRGVRAPVRLTGRLRGVLFRSDLPEQARATSVWEIADCRLVLALDDFAEILARHGVVEVRHYSMYRPPRKTWPEGKDATRHKGGLAIDAGRFILADGSVIDIDGNYKGRIGSTSCGPKARPPRPATAAAKLLRALVCEAVDRHLFNVVLTPNHDRKHRNHFHLEVAAGVRWFLVR